MSYIAVILITLFISAMLTGSEMAFLSSNKLMIEINRQRYPLYSKLTDIFYNNRQFFISTIFTGNLIALVVFAITLAVYSSADLMQLTSSSFLTLCIQILLATIVILLFTRFLPKLIFRLNPIRSLNIISLPLLVFYILLYPLSRPLYKFCNYLKQKLGYENSLSPGELAIGKINLDHLMADQRDIENDTDEIPEEIKFFRNALDFSTVKIRECSIPRTDLEAIDIEEDIEVLKSRFIATGYSKILVYRENIDHIVGYVHISALFNSPEKIQNVITPISVVPESMTANKLLEIFTKEHKSIALVVDEFGGTSGIVTLEDILEEIFGEIDDEHDVSDLIEMQISDNSYKFSARLEIDHLNEKYNLQLPVGDDYETIAGLILLHTEAIPEVGEEIVIDNFSLKILEASKSKIDLVQITIDAS